MPLDSNITTYCMYLYEAATERGMTSSQAKQAVINELLQAAQSFADKGGLEFVPTGIINPKAVMHDSIKLAEDLVVETKHNAPANVKAKKLVNNLQAMRNMLKKE